MIVDFLSRIITILNFTQLPLRQTHNWNIDCVLRYSYINYILAFNTCFRSAKGNKNCVNFLSKVL